MSSRGVEAVIAASIVIAGILNLVPRLPLMGAPLAFGFGLVHGLGFAGALQALGGNRLVSLAGFNVGVEFGQLAVVALAVPLLFTLRRAEPLRLRATDRSVARMCGRGFVLARREARMSPIVEALFSSQEDLDMRFSPIAAGVAAALVLPLVSQASSHREAPNIALMPAVDSTDVYAFMSYEQGRGEYVTLLADYVPLQDPYGGPNYFALDQRAIYEIHVDSDGDAREDTTFQFRFDNFLGGTRPHRVGGAGGRQANRRAAAEHRQGHEGATIRPC